MLLAICPECSGLALVSDKCLKDIIHAKKGSCTCSKCSLNFNIIYDETAYKLRERKINYDNSNRMQR